MPKTNNPSDVSASPHSPSPTMRPSASAPAPQPRRKSRVELGLRRAWRHIYFRFPGVVPSPYPDNRDYLKRRDADDNMASRVPEGESPRQIALWGVEVFGPGEIDALQLAMDRLGWNVDRLLSFNTNPGSWIGEQRTYGTEGSFNLGVIERPGKSRFLPRGRQAPLPEGVDYAHGYVYQLSPSLTAVIICFELTESASDCYCQELNLDRNTENEPFENGYRSYDVEHVKRRAIDSARSRSRALVVDWFKQFLPGRFSCASDGNRLPTAELITTINQSLFVRRRTNLEPRWCDLLIPRGHHEVWADKSCDGVALCWLGSKGDLRYHSIVNLQTGLLAADHLEHRGEGNSAHASLVCDQVQGVLVNFAAIAALREIIRFLRLTPNSLSVDTKSRRGTVKSLERIQLYFDKSVGVPALTSELVTKSEKVHSYKWNCAAFQTVPWLPDEDPVEIAEALRFRTNFLASRAANLEKETREHLEQLSAILSTRENIRTQARMELVAVIATILSLASLAVAVMSVDRFATYVNQQVETLYKSE